MKHFCLTHFCVGSQELYLTQNLSCFSEVHLKQLIVRPRVPPPHPIIIQVDTQAQIRFQFQHLWVHRVERLECRLFPLSPRSKDPDHITAQARLEVIMVPVPLAELSMVEQMPLRHMIW